MRARLERIRYLVGVLGVRGALGRVARRALAPLYYSELLYVTNDYLVEVPDDRESGPGAVNTEVVDSLEELAARRDRLHPDIDFAVLAAHLRQGSSRASVALVAHEDEAGTVTYVGYTTHDVGSFRMPEYRFGGPLAGHIEVGYDWLIVPEFRGRGLSSRGRYGEWMYRVERGVWVSTGVVRSHNAPSLRASVRQNHGTLSVVPGSFRLTRWLGGLRVHAPPWDEVRAMMESVPEGYEPPSGIRPSAGRIA